ncbi:MAG: hypothetical protein ACKOOH_08445 [Cyanobium sp.]
MSRHPFHRCHAVERPGPLSPNDLAALTDSQRWVAMIIGMGVAMVMVANLSSALLLSGGEPPPIRQATVLKR